MTARARAARAARTTAAVLLPATLGIAAAALARAATAEAARLWAGRAALAFDDLVLAAALAVLAAAAGWLGLALVLTVAAHALRRTGGVAHRLAAAVTPPLCRRLVAALLGGVCGAGVLSAPAGAAPVCTGEPPCLPVPDRPVGAGGPTRGTSASTSGSASVGAAVLVRAGDTLWAIAERHLPARAGGAEVAAAWPAWYAANRSRIGPDPHLIRPGTRLRVPAHTRASAEATRPDPS